MSQDLLDSLLNLEAPHPLHGVRQYRAKVAEATQASHALLFGPALAAAPSLEERLLVALQAALLAPSPVLAAHYREALAQAGVATGTITAVSEQREAELPARLQAILAFSRVLSVKPVDGDRAALMALRDAGLSDQEIVALAQLVAYLSYQLRLAAGLAALRDAGVQP